MRKWSAIPWSHARHVNGERTSAQLVFMIPEGADGEPKIILPNSEPACRVVMWNEDGNLIELPIEKKNLLAIAQEIVDRLTTEAAT